MLNGAGRGVKRARAEEASTASSVKVSDTKTSESKEEAKPLAKSEASAAPETPETEEAPVGVGKAAVSGRGRGRGRGRGKPTGEAKEVPTGPEKKEIPSEDIPRVSAGRRCTENYLAMLRKGEDSNGVLISSDGTRLPIHRANLSAQCPELAKQFKTQTEVKAAESTRVLVQLLNFIYTGLFDYHPGLSGEETNGEETTSESPWGTVTYTDLARGRKRGVDVKFCLEMVVVARHYRLDALFWNCIDAIGECMDDSIVLDCYSISQKHRIKALERACIAYLSADHQLATLMDKPEWAKLDGTIRDNLVKDVLRSQPRASASSSSSRGRGRGGRPAARRGRAPVSRKAVAEEAEEQEGSEEQTDDE